jgi:hypothetical protein
MRQGDSGQQSEPRAESHQTSRENRARSGRRRPLNGNGVSSGQKRQLVASGFAGRRLDARIVRLGHDNPDHICLRDSLQRKKYSIARQEAQFSSYYYGVEGVKYVLHGIFQVHIRYSTLHARHG